MLRPILTHRADRLPMIAFEDVNAHLREKVGIQPPRAREEVLKLRDNAFGLPEDVSVTDHQNGLIGEYEQPVKRG